MSMEKRLMEGEMRELALVLDLLDCAEAIAQQSGKADLNSEARQLVRAHPDADVPVEYVASTLRQEVAKSQEAN
jgi:hypothetical protein